MDKKCIVCDDMFYAKRNTATFCSATCRVKYSRQVDDTSVKSDVTLNKPNTDVDAEGFPLDHTKFTQGQVEQYYTLERFPSRLRYYSAAGGGSGSLSPWPASHPAYATYTLR